ncbi:enoyl-CoA hydratase/isomerase family protein [Virgibacillus sp. C22-A2]|uniref:Enoyl-CoA hydratase/isomerase family protein n=1 Tax=Virgibacillus tibetensis TaxID=3042313 RepID=A0ABU6KHM1_9BACI|nr:enoyl-CoA hydratase/isomerase family protein [Virgibacillus sp. C22-A2]
MNFETIHLEKKNDVLWVWLNRENKVSTINLKMMKELIGLADWLREESEIKFVVFTNKGKLFSAGFDLYNFNEEIENKDEAPQFIRSMSIIGQELMRKLENLEQISIAALRGSAYGGGVAIAMTTDFRLMADGTVFNLPETNVGLFLNWGCTPRLVKAVGALKAKEIIMLCEDITSDECSHLGLVNKVVSTEKLDNEVDQLIEKIRGKGYYSIRMTKKLVNASIMANVGDVFINEPELAERVITSGETKEKVDKFMKRAQK